MGQCMKKANNPSKLTTIYLPNNNAETLKTWVSAKEEEMQKIKDQSLKISEYLMSDRNKAYHSLQQLRIENNEKFEMQQNEMAELSKEHLYHIKEYLIYRRNTKQEMHDLMLNFFKMKDENNKMRKKYNDKVEHIESSKDAKERAIKKESNKIVNGFRIETMRKHKELNNVRNELATLTKSYHFDVNHLKNKLLATKRKNKRLSQMNKCQKQGIQSDVENLKKRLGKLQKNMNSLSFADDANDLYQASLQKEINKIKDALLQLAKISKAEE